MAGGHQVKTIGSPVIAQQSKQYNQRQELLVRESR
jgi:hypothetical protein